MKALLSFFFLVWATTGFAQNRFSIPIDSTFTGSKVGSYRTVEGERFYAVAVLHKVIEKDGRMYVCAGSASLFPLKGTQAKVESLQGQVIRNGLAGWGDLAPSVRLTASQRKAVVWGSNPQLVAYPSDPKYYSGATVPCMRAKRGLSPDVLEGNSIVVLRPKLLQFANTWLK